MYSNLAFLVATTTKNRDLCNGFTVAEIFSWYYPQNFNMATYNTGQSLDSRMLNWALIKRVSFVL